MNQLLLMELNRVRYEEFLRQATAHHTRSGGREPRRPHRARHRRR